MRLLFFHSTWGLERPTAEEKLWKIKEAGFDGVELGVPDTLKECGATRRVLDETGLVAIIQQWTAGRNADEHARRCRIRGQPSGGPPCALISPGGGASSSLAGAGTRRC
jgi:sugar phosphate isomerase/epimerase